MYCLLQHIYIYLHIQITNYISFYYHVYRTHYLWYVCLLLYWIYYNITYFIYLKKSKKYSNFIFIVSKKNIVLLYWRVTKRQVYSFSYIFNTHNIFFCRWIYRCVGLLVMAGWIPRPKAWYLHPHSINAIFYGRPSPYGRLSCLGKGFLLRCFQELS